MGIQCKECDSSFNRNCDISRHVKKQNLEFISYIKKYYKLSCDVKFRKCSFCDNVALPKFKINHIDSTYEIFYNNGYSCNTIECKKKISIDILGTEYDSKKFEKIGSRSDYLAKLYDISIEDSKKMKYDTNKVNFFDNSLNSFIELYGETEGKNRHENRINGISKNSARNKFPCTLENFILKHGKEKGTDLYNKRCEKISYSSSVDFYIEKYGIEEGKLRYKNKMKQTKVSKKSKIISDILYRLNIKYLSEENIGSKQVDFFIEEFKIAIEYFGDYWHCNPKKYNSSYYNSRIKMFAKEVWEKDGKRLDLILESVNSIIIVWESTNIDDSLLEKTLNNIKDKKTIIYL